MNKILSYMLLGLVTLSSCSSDETYAEQKEKERDAVAAFLGRNVVIKDKNGETLCNVGVINPIDEAQFAEQGYKTDLASNQYVLINSTGVYMQIVREGVGEKMKSGDNKRLAVRFLEFNILGDSLMSSNLSIAFANYPDIMDVTCSYGSFSASFNTTVYGTGAMYASYGSTAVPGGWLAPLPYVRVGRQTTEGEGIAKVRLIVPHSQGTSTATNAVYPCFYELTLQELRN